MMIKPIYEFVLWNNCNCNCSFCWQKKKTKPQTSADKLVRIKQVDDFMHSSRFEVGSHVLLVGGELFDCADETIQHELIALLTKLVEMQCSNVVDLLYINTNLCYDMHMLQKFLDVIAQYAMFERLRFTTSFDVYGRFKCESQANIWNANMKKLHDAYPELRVVVNTILTKQFCDFQQITGNSWVKRIRDEYGAYVNLIPYVNVDSAMLPTANQVMNALALESESNPGYLKPYIENFELKQDKKVFSFAGNTLNDFSAGVSPCGHGINFARYSAEGSCFICDVKKEFA